MLRHMPDAKAISRRTKSMNTVAARGSRRSCRQTTCQLRLIGMLLTGSTHKPSRAG